MNVSTSTQVLLGPVPSPPQSNVLKETDSLIDYLRQQKIPENSSRIDELIKKFNEDTDALKRIFDSCVGKSIGEILKNCSDI